MHRSQILTDLDENWHSVVENEHNKIRFRYGLRFIEVIGDAETSIRPPNEQSLLSHSERVEIQKKETQHGHLGKTAGFHGQFDQN